MLTPEEEERRSKWDRRFLEDARSKAQWSKDPSTKVGAVIVDPATLAIISQGYNGFPRGVKDTPERLNDRERKLGTTLHAECNAILFARCPLVGFWIYTWPIPPCSSPCGAAIIQVGITRVIAPRADSPKWERWKKSIDLAFDNFREAGVEITLFPSVPMSDLI